MNYRKNTITTKAISDIKSDIKNTQIELTKNAKTRKNQLTKSPEKELQNTREELKTININNALIQEEKALEISNLQTKNIEQSSRDKKEQKITKEFTVLKKKFNTLNTENSENLKLINKYKKYSRHKKKKKKC